MKKSLGLTAPTAFAVVLLASGWASAQTLPAASALPPAVTVDRALQSVAPAPQPVIDLPILGLAQVSIRVSDLKRSSAFYGGVLGLPEAFTLKGRDGKIASVYFKVNDDQYLELIPGLPATENVRQIRLVIQASDLEKLHQTYVGRNLNPGPITKGPDGNPIFRVVAPNGFPMDFIQYAADSRQGALRGKLLVPQRISDHLLHAGTMVTDDATKAFFAKFGWGRMLPGTRGDYVETPATDRNLETKNPPLDPANPATKAQYTRELLGAAYHFSLEITDMHAARELLKKRGGYDDMRLRVAVGNNRHWLLHLFDPDGTRVELMSKETLPDNVPAFSVMPPGPPAPPILAKTRGIYPWP